MAPLLIFALLIVVPIIEISLFIQAGKLIGLWATLAIVIMTVFAGTTLLRRQGVTVLNRFRVTLARNELPVIDLFDDVLLLTAGVTLVIPGLMTDVVGFLLLFPPVRAAMALVLLHRISGRMQRCPNGQPGGGRTRIIDADYEDLTDRNPPAGRSRGPLR